MAIVKLVGKVVYLGSQMSNILLQLYWVVIPLVVLLFYLWSLQNVAIHLLWSFIVQNSEFLALISFHVIKGAQIKLWNDLKFWRWHCKRGLLLRIVVRGWQHRMIFRGRIILLEMAHILKDFVFDATGWSNVLELQVLWFRTRFE